MSDNGPAGQRRDAYHHPRVIWLQPWCGACADASLGDGRVWCENDEWGKCPDCGRKAIRYVMSQRASSDTALPAAQEDTDGSAELG